MSAPLGDGPARVGDAGTPVLATEAALLGAVELRYVAAWGPPAGGKAVTAGDHKFQVWHWVLGDGSARRHVYATIGASAHPMSGANPSHRNEYFLVLNSETEGAVVTLVLLAAHTAGGAFISHGHTVMYDDPLWPGIEARHVIALGARQPYVPPLAKAGAQVEFLQVVPVFEPEVAYTKSHSALGLVHLWASHVIDVQDPKRSAPPADVFATTAEVCSKCLADQTDSIHYSPLRRNRADFIILADTTRKSKQQRWEQIWARRLDANRFEVCCIPFRAYDLALGDIVEAGPRNGRMFVVRDVIGPSGHYTFRAWFGDSQDQVAKAEVPEALTRLGADIEWATHNLLAVDATPELAQSVADMLHDREQKGHLLYETGRTQ